MAGCSVRQRKKKNFLVKVGMQSIPHNATLLQLLQRLVPGQDNEMTACGVEGESSLTPISPVCTLCTAVALSSQLLCFSELYYGGLLYEK